jgi:hypothetical protein
MFELRWLGPAQDAFEELDERDREAILVELETVRSFPNLYPARLNRPFLGSRQFVVRNRWTVIYHVMDDIIWVRVIYPARAKPL